MAKKIVLASLVLILCLLLHGETGSMTAASCDPVSAGFAQATGPAPASGSASPSPSQTFCGNVELAPIHLPKNGGTVAKKSPGDIVGSPRSYDDSRSITSLLRALQNGGGQSDTHSPEADFDYWESLLDPERRWQRLDANTKELLARLDAYGPLVLSSNAPEMEKIAEADALFRQGNELYEARHCSRALPLLEEARKIFQSLGHVTGQVRALSLQSNCQIAEGDVFAALATMMQIASIIEELPQKRFGDHLSEMARARHATDDLLGARKFLREALDGYQKTGDPAGVARVTMDLANVAHKSENYTEAEKYLHQVLELLAPVNEDSTLITEAAAHHNLGHITNVTGRPQQAMMHYCTALRAWRVLGESAHEVSALSGLAMALSGQGNHDGGMKVLQEAWALQERLPANARNEGNLLNHMGLIQANQGKLSEALDYHRRALSRHREPGSEEQLRILVNIGGVQQQMGRLDDASTTYQQVLDLAEKQGTGTAMIETRAYMNIAAIAVDRGDYRQGIRHYLDALSLAKRINSSFDEGSIELNLSTAYIHLGDLIRAEKHLNRSLEIFRKIGYREGVAAAQLNLGSLLMRVERTVPAESNIREAMEIYRELANPAAASAQANLAVSMATRGDYKGALQLGREALSAGKKAGNLGLQLRVLLQLSAFHFQLGEHSIAADHVLGALELAVAIEDRVAEVSCRAFLAMIYYSQRDRAAGRYQLQRAFGLLENLRGSITAPELKSDFLDQYIGFYDVAVLINIAEDRPAEAFAYIEQARARALLDQIGNHQVSFRDPGSAPDRIAEVEKLRRRLSYLRAELHTKQYQAFEQPDDKELAELTLELESARSRYADLLTQLRLDAPEYASVISIDTLTLREVQAQVLDEHTTLIEFHVPDEALSEVAGDHIWAWVVDREGYELIRLDIGTRELRVEIASMRNTIASRGGDRGREAGLHARLMAPLVPHIRHQNLVIVPDGVLYYLPFAALWDADHQRYLIEDYTITQAPSASALKFTLARRTPNEGRLLILGNPDGSLPHAAAEAQAIAELYGTTPRLGKRATESEVRAQAGQIDVLHLAAHANHNPYQPLFGRIELAADGSEDGALEVHEIFGLDLRGTDLVVLSACRTRMGELSRGNEMVGLGRAFLYAGTSSLVASLWAVEDRSTSRLMRRFHTHLRAGAGRAEALRRAQLEMSAEGSPPYYWAAFVLIGDGS